MTRYRPAALVGLAALLAASPAFTGAPVDVPPDVQSRIKATLAAHLPSVVVEHIRSSPIPGLYEIDTPEEIVYSDDTGSKLVLGRIVDSQSKEDLTAARWNQINAIDFGTLPLEKAIKTVRGDGSRKLAVFADPLCPFCRQLEEQMKDVTNVTIYTFLYPLESIHPGATEKANRIWCAKDRAAAWSEWMLKHVEPPAATCDPSAVGELQALGEKLRVNSTPTMFLADGRRARGAMAQDKLEQLLARSKVNPVTPGS